MKITMVLHLFTTVLHLFLLHSEKLVLLTMVLNINFQTHQQWFPATLDWAMVLWFIINQLSAYWKWSYVIKVIFICVNSSQKPKVAPPPDCCVTSCKSCHFSMPYLISKRGNNNNSLPFKTAAYCIGFLFGFFTAHEFSYKFRWIKF